MDRGKMLYRAKTAYASGARGAGQVLARAGLGRSPLPTREKRLRHWACSLSRVHDPLAIAELDVPWWTYDAIDLVDAWLAERCHPIRVFEYGSGASTLWLGRRADQVYTVDHDRAFGEQIAAAFHQDETIEFRIVEPSPSEDPKVPSAKEGYANLDFADYVATIDQIGGQFSLIAIDGRAREACLAAAIPHLEPDGIVVFDNSRRRRYREAIAATPLTERRLRGLTPTLPYPDQTSVLSLTPQLY